MELSEPVSKATGVIAGIDDETNYYMNLLKCEHEKSSKDHVDDCPQCEPEMILVEIVYNEFTKTVEFDYLSFFGSLTDLINITYTDPIVDFNTVVSFELFDVIYDKKYLEDPAAQYISENCKLLLITAQPETSDIPME